MRAFMARWWPAIGAAVGLLALAWAQVVIARQPAGAQDLVSAATGVARAERKVVLVEFGASWCGWCRRFDEFLHAPGVGEAMAHNYVIVKLTGDEAEGKKGRENPGAGDIKARWSGKDVGLPFYVFLDGEGDKIADSRAMPDGSNISFRGTTEEVEAFGRLLDRTAPRLKSAERANTINCLLRRSKK